MNEFPESREYESPLSPSSSSLENIIDNLSLSSNPDKEIEIFWYCFKHSIINFCKKDKALDDILNSEIRRLSQWFNTLKKNKQYSLILSNISLFINNYIIIIMKYTGDYYHTNILVTNIKRWKRLLETQLFIDNGSNYYLDKSYLTVVKIYNKLSKKYTIKNTNDLCMFFKSITIKNINSDSFYEDLLDLLLKYNIGTCIDELKLFFDVHQYINKKFNTNIYKSTTGGKIITYLINNNLIDKVTI